MPHQQYQATPFCDSATTFKFTWPAPLDIAASLSGFQRWGEDLIDRWEGRTWLRTIKAGNDTIPFRCEVVGTVEQPLANITVEQSSAVEAVKQALIEVFISAPDATRELLLTDPQLAQLDKQFPGVRPVRQPDLFTTLIRSISAQQVNLQWATTTRRRLAEGFGRQHRLGHDTVYSLVPERLANLAPQQLRDLQFTTRKAEYIINLAQRVCNGELDLDSLRDQPDAEVINTLTALRGLGRWTAEWFLARGLGRACVVAGDLGVRKAIGKLYGKGPMATEAEVRAWTAHWGAASGVAQQIVLHALSEGWLDTTRPVMTR